jgi:hypothetical protein
VNEFFFFEKSSFARQTFDDLNVGFLVALAVVTRLIFRLNFLPSPFSHFFFEKTLKGPDTLIEDRSIIKL